MKKEALVIQYREYRSSMSDFPVSSPMWKKIKQKMSDFLQEVRDQHGQEAVNDLTKKRSKWQKRKMHKKLNKSLTPSSEG